MCGKHQHFGYLHVLGSACCVERYVGNVVAYERLDALIYIVGTLVIAMETDVGEVGLNESGLQVGHSYTCMGYIDAQSVGKGLDGSLCSTVDSASGISCIASYTTYIYHMTVVKAHHLRHHKASHVEQSLDVGVNHLVPVLEVTLVFGLQTTCQSGIVDEHVDGLESIGYACHSIARSLTIAHVEGEREHLHPTCLKFSLQRLKLVGRTACNDKIVATNGKTACASHSYSACSTSDKSCLSFHVSDFLN